MSVLHRVYHYYGQILTSKLPKTEWLFAGTPGKKVRTQNPRYPWKGSPVGPEILPTICVMSVWSSANAAKHSNITIITINSCATCSWYRIIDTVIHNYRNSSLCVRSNHSNDMVKLLRYACPSAFLWVLLCFIVHLVLLFFLILILSICPSVCLLCMLWALLPDFK